MAERTGDTRFLPLVELAASDVLTLHVPLTHAGPHATHLMIDRDILGRMKTGSVLINASRGGVVDERALLDSLRGGRLGGAAVDAWIGEPDICVDLLKSVTVATPHIAGYSADGKLRGTEMIHRGLCRFLDRAPEWKMESVLEPIAGSISIGGENPKMEDRLARIVEEAYPLMNDDAALRTIAGMNSEDRGRRFDSLRKNYPVRREFHAFELDLEQSGPQLEKAALGLGFRVGTSAASPDGAD